MHIRNVLNTHMYIFLCTYNNICMHICAHVSNDIIYKWHVCLGSYILEQEESRDIRKKAGGEGREEGMKLDS